MEIEIKDTDKELYIIVDGKKFDGDGILDYLIERGAKKSELKITFIATNLKTIIDKNNTKKKDY